MTPIESRIKDIYERKLGREIEEAEVLQIGVWYRQFAELLLRWSNDDTFCRRLSRGEVIDPEPIDPTLHARTRDRPTQGKRVT